jgi:hypothetical protein
MRRLCKKRVPFKLIEYILINHYQSNKSIDIQIMAQGNEKYVRVFDWDNWMKCFLIKVKKNIEIRVVKHKQQTSMPIHLYI